MSSFPRFDACNFNVMALSTLARTLERENAQLREALAWFADSRNYEDTQDRVMYLKDNIVWANGIARARAALGET